MERSTRQAPVTALMLVTTRLPRDRRQSAHVSHEDVAAEAVAALLGERHANKIYETSGREAISARELAAVLSDQTGPAVEAVDVPLPAFADQFRDMGLPEWMVTG